MQIPPQYRNQTEIQRLREPVEKLTGERGGDAAVSASQVEALLEAILGGAALPTAVFEENAATAWFAEDIVRNIVAAESPWVTTKEMYCLGGRPIFLRLKIDCAGNTGTAAWTLAHNGTVIYSRTAGMTETRSFHREVKIDSTPGLNTFVLTMTATGDGDVDFDHMHATELKL